MDTKLLLMQALNKTHATFAHSSHEAKELTDGSMRISFDSVTKSVCFRYGKNVVKIDLKELAITGLEYLNHIKISNLDKFDNMMEVINKHIQFEDDQITFKTDIILRNGLNIGQSLELAWSLINDFGIQITDISDWKEIVNSDIHIIQIGLDMKADLIYVNHELNNKSDRRHLHTYEDIPSLENVLSSKANQTTVDEIQSDIHTIQIGLDMKADLIYVNHELNNKSDRRHQHTYDDIFSLESDLNTIRESIEDKANISHEHDVEDITNLDTILDPIRYDISFKSDINHDHEIDNINNLQERLNEKANISHGHGIENITNLLQTLNSKSNNGHIHNIDNITDLQTKLDKITTDIDDLEDYVNDIKKSIPKEKSSFWSWFYDLADTGVTAAGFAAMQSQINALQAAMTAATTAITALQTQLATLQIQVARLDGTMATQGLIDDINIPNSQPGWLQSLKNAFSRTTSHQGEVYDRFSDVSGSGAGGELLANFGPDLLSI